MNRVLPVVVVLLAVIAVWYPAAAWLNYDQAAALADDGAPTADIVRAAWSLDRPLLPAPHQIAAEVWDSVTGWPIDSPRSLAHHALVTAGAALLGLAFALAVGLALAVIVVHSRTLDRALTPWLIVGQTIPVLAIAPMLIVVLGNIGFTGLLPKALIAGWLSFLPITLGMIKGLRNAEPVHLDLMRTYSAGRARVFALLRWPASMAFLFPSVKVAATLALVGAIVAELPTGAQAGLGARLLAGSYYGQTMQIWAALAAAAALAVCAIGAVDGARALLAARRGGRL